MLIPVILAGGAGSRLWPLSRGTHPKQLLPLIDNLSMLQHTVLRACKMIDAAPPLVMCNEEHYFLIVKQLHEIGVYDATIILEPERKNTAAAITIAAAYLAQKHDDPSLLVLPADHFIKDDANLIVAIHAAEKLANDGAMVMFGVQPTRPETGYGYIKANGLKVERFIEKPDLESAKEYLAAKNYYWNCGIFLFRSSCVLAEMAMYASDIFHACQKVVAAISRETNPVVLDKTLFLACKADSIDYALMEKTQNAFVIPLGIEWSDIGSWTSLWEMYLPDHSGNVIHGDVVTEQVRNSYVYTENRTIVTVGVQDLVVVATADAVLVAHKDSIQSIKEVINKLNTDQFGTRLHKRVYRPWGSYEILNRSEFFQVKRLTIMPGAGISLQMHHHRSEHWVIVSGKAEVVRGDETLIYTANESTYIPAGMKHRLTNRDKQNLEVIEVQLGAYLGEDDVIRLVDDEECSQTA